MWFKMVQKNTLVVQVMKIFIYGRKLHTRTVNHPQILYGINIKFPLFSLRPQHDTYCTLTQYLSKLT